MQENNNDLPGLINIKEETNEPVQKQEQKQEQKQIAYILTNGFLDFGYNFAKMFRTKKSAIKYAKYNYINIVYNYHEVEVPADSVYINMMTTSTLQPKYIVECIGDEMEFYNKMLTYYKSMNIKYMFNPLLPLTVKSSIKIKEGKTIIQMITQNESFNNFSWFGPLYYEPSSL